MPCIIFTSLVHQCISEVIVTLTCIIVVIFNFHFLFLYSPHTLTSSMKVICTMFLKVYKILIMLVNETDIFLLFSELVLLLDYDLSLLRETYCDYACV